MAFLTAHDQGNYEEKEQQFEVVKVRQDFRLASVHYLKNRHSEALIG
jgi:hypothetical protein